MLELRLLGRPRVVLDGETVTGFVSDKAVALLCYVALNQGQLPRKRLAGLLWGEKTGKRANANLRVALHNVKQLLPGYLEITRKRVGLNRSRRHWIDVVAFTTRAEEGATVDALEEARRLYQEDFLRGLFVEGAPGLEAWLRMERERLRLRLISLLERLAEAYGARSKWRQATAVMRQLLTVEPWREQTHRQLLLLLARQGEYAAALAQYDSCQDTLAGELGVEPMPTTKKLYQRIKRLRCRPQHYLPQIDTPLVGREEQLADLRRYLDQPACRLLTLHGPGGIGKTRLALALARSVRDRFLEGVFYVPLSDVGSPRHLALAIAESMGFSFAGPRPFSEQLLDHLEGQELLLVLDNFEQLLAGKAFVQQLLARARDIRVLTASRVVLNLRGEWTFEVTGLALPGVDADDIAGAEAVQLFLQRVQQLRPGYAPDPSELQTICQICHLLEGVPLAVEQAASWLRILSCGQLLDELETGLFSLEEAGVAAPRRQDSMKAVLEQSWRLLKHADQIAFQRLSVFRGGFTRRAATAVAAASIQRLARLADASMIHYDEASERYQMHELLRQYGAKKLAEAEDRGDAVRNRHVAYYATFMEERCEALERSEEETARAFIRRELENVAAAWNHLLAQPRFRQMQSFVKSLWYFFELEGWYREGMETYENGLAALRAAAVKNGDSSHERLYGQLLCHYGWFQIRTGAFVQAEKSLEEGVELLRRYGTNEDLAIPLFFWGFGTHLMGKYGLGRELLEESLAIHDATDVRHSAVFPRAALAHLLLSTGALAHAQALAEQVERESKALGGHRVVSNALYLRGMCALASRDVGTAKDYFQKGLAVSKAAGDSWNIGMCSHYMGRAAILSGEYEVAAEWLQDGLSSMRSLEEKLGAVFCLLGLGWAQQGQGALRSSRGYFDEALELAIELNVQPQLLEALVGIASCMLAESKTGSAVQLLRFVVAHPATAHAVRQQAQMLLNDLGGGRPGPHVQGSRQELEPALRKLMSPRFAYLHECRVGL